LNEGQTRAATLPQRWIANEIAFTPDSRFLMAFGQDGRVRLWHLNLDEMLDLAREAVGRELTADERVQYGIGQDSSNPIIDTASGPDDAKAASFK
jgi:hypothetical protein